MTKEYESGQALAGAIVDYIGAIPARISCEQEADYWRGYLDAERERAALGLRSQAEYEIAKARFDAAIVSNRA